MFAHYIFIRLHNYLYDKIVSLTKTCFSALFSILLNRRSFQFGSDLNLIAGTRINIKHPTNHVPPTFVTAYAAAPLESLVIADAWNVCIAAAEPHPTVIVWHHIQLQSTAWLHFAGMFFATSLTAMVAAGAVFWRFLWIHLMLIHLIPAGTFVLGRQYLQPHLYRRGNSRKFQIWITVNWYLSLCAAMSCTRSKQNATIKNQHDDDDGWCTTWQLPITPLLQRSTSTNPTTRHSIFSVVIGGFFYWTSLFCTNQASVQKCMSLKSMKKAKTAICFAILGKLPLSGATAAEIKYRAAALILKTGSNTSTQKIKRWSLIEWRKLFACEQFQAK